MNWLQRFIRKVVLAHELMNRGVCLRHGTRLVPDRSHGVVGYGGVIPAIPTCRECEEERWQASVEAAMAHEAETESMWEEYRKLC
jgi:hypothetical protein